MFPARNSGKAAGDSSTLAQRLARLLPLVTCISVTPCTSGCTARMSTNLNKSRRNISVLTEPHAAHLRNGFAGICTGNSVLA